MSDETLQQLVDELAIRRVLDEYCLRLELNSFDEWMDLFTPDTVYEVYKLKLTGRKEVTDVLSQAPHGVHLGGAARIIIDGDSAVTLQNYAFISTGTDEWNAGWYHRELVRTREGWKISRTRVQFARKDDLPENERARKLAYPISFG
ncbi:MAG: nuclear transport factor 2 family protein [Novosphingobium sp.]|nr:nuclear transport factor 2 family protein [Novosphingobium sp.]